MMSGSTLVTHVFVVAVTHGLFQKVVFTRRTVRAQLHFAIWLTEVSMRTTVVTLLRVGGFIIAVPTVGTGIFCGRLPSRAITYWANS